MTLGKATALAMALVGATAMGIWIGPHVTEPSALTTEMNHAHTTATAAAKTAETPALPASSPDVQRRLRPLMNQGTKMELAADGFPNAETFAAVAHAAHNTRIPFVLLKHRVLNEGKSLATAIKESQPDVDASVEADLARVQARRDLALLNG
jgi:hypothetical protein